MSGRPPEFGSPEFGSLGRGEPVEPDVATAIVATLGRLGYTLAVAESLTGGLVAARIVAVPGASAVLRGGIVAYATDLKASLLDVDADLLARGGPVQPQVAAEMAAGVRRRLGASWGVGVTGVAGPGAQDGVPAGTVHLAVEGPAGERIGSTPALTGDRRAIRDGACDAVLQVLVRMLAEAERGASG